MYNVCSNFETSFLKHLNKNLYDDLVSFSRRFFKLLCVLSFLGIFVFCACPHMTLAVVDDSYEAELNESK